MVIELAVLGAIWAWLFGDTAQTSNSRGLVEKIGAALLGAFVVNVVQLLWGNLRNGNSPQSSSSQPGTNARTVARGTNIKGEGNKFKVTQKDVLAENTEIVGKGNEFSITDDDNSSSPQQNNSLNP
ncbi:hypothetical protein [Nostoc parmelioides]|uniref:hypothetical protein n=1 Tax=Nostoc parmelioides TaxID=1521621 RepID=UPI0016845749|nr:hypothetical protein [Nostoc parmelioides]